MFLLQIVILIVFLFKSRTCVPHGYYYFFFSSPIYQSVIIVIVCSPVRSSSSFFFPDFAVCSSAFAWFYVQAWSLYWWLHVVLSSEYCSTTFSTFNNGSSNFIFIPSKTRSTGDWLWNHWWSLWLVCWLRCNANFGGCDFNENLIYGRTGRSCKSAYCCSSFPHLHLLWNS